MKHVLYISLNGVTEPLVRSQVIAYLQGLARTGYRFTLLTFEREPLARAERESIQRDLLEHGITWHPLPRARRAGPMSIVLDVWRGYRRSRRLAREGNVALVHARSFVPAIIAALVKKNLGVPFINDTRGFWVDEKVYKGSIRPGGVIYRAGKRVEGWTLRASDAIVMLSERGRRELASFGCFGDGAIPPVAVIPTCVEIGRFQPGPRASGVRVVCGYVGSMSPEYLPEKTIEYFAVMREHFPGSELRLITRTHPGPILDLIDAANIPREAVSIRAVPPDEVPAQTSAFHVGLCFIRPHFSKLASCPTKVGEYLAAGVPVVGNAGIGDLDELLRHESVGVVLPDLSRRAMEQSMVALAAQFARTDLRDACRRVASAHFSLEKGIAAYASIYESLASMRAQ